MSFLTNIMNWSDGLKRINTLTKYPSIMTYHDLGQKGGLVDSLVDGKSFDERDVYITEKIDGTNTRFVFITNRQGLICDYLVGSREDFLYAAGDRILTDPMGLVKTTLSEWRSLHGGFPGDCKMVMATLYGVCCKANTFEPSSIYCVYGETYGGKINAHKQYSGHNTFGLRVFDMWHMPLDDAEQLLRRDIAELSQWREHGGQPFVSVEELNVFCQAFNLQRVPYLKVMPGTELPTDLQGVWDWMQQYKTSVAGLDEGAGGLSEGVVVRYADRSLIRKIRFEDYQKTKKKGLIK